MQGCKNAVSRYLFLKDAARENEELKKELFALKTRVIDYNHQVQEVTRLRSLIGFTNLYEQPVTVAEVVNLSVGSPFRSLRIGKGQNEKILLGMPVVSEKGTVGRILRSGQFFSDVQLMSDHSFHLDVIMERTRMRGVLQGAGQNRCRLELHRRADIRIGDTLITSGLTAAFPKGLPVGEVTKISYDSDDVSQIVTVQPWVNYEELEEVVVIHKKDEHMETIMETVGQEWMEQTLNQVSFAQ